MAATNRDSSLEPRPEQSPFLALLGTRLRRWEPGLVEIVLDLRQDLTNRAGIIHGGVISALLDHGGGYSGTYCEVEGNARYAVTMSLTCNFIAQAKSGSLVTIGRKTGGGKHVYFADVEIRDDEGHLVATGSGVYRYRSGSERPEGVQR